MIKLTKEVRDRFDELAREYRTEETTDRRRGKILMIISDTYRNTKLKESKTIVPRDQDDYWQWFYYKIIYALNKWKDNGSASFTTFLGICLVGVRQTYLNNDYKKLKVNLYKKYDNRPVQIVHSACMDYDKDYLEDIYPEREWSLVKKSVMK